ncbi:hypothetical protein MHK_008000 [Candidatus Magnetomorum sp. HK-1]|nr:hypothetical protein MHK_008000 [Candidatus Magnetomorum sp. HK-1]
MSPFLSNKERSARTSPFPYNSKKNLSTYNYTAIKKCAGLIIA